MALENDDIDVARAIRLLVLDVDGVLTDGRLYYGPEGEAFKTFDVKDGFALKAALGSGVRVAVISARSSAAAAKRCAELGVEVVHLGVHDKGATFESVLTELDCSAQEVAAIGDDLADLPVLQACGLAFAPADAVAEVRAACDVTLSRPGGRGAVREMVELILGARGQWPPVQSR